MRRKCRISLLRLCSDRGVNEANRDLHGLRTIEIYCASLDRFHSRYTSYYRVCVDVKNLYVNLMCNIDNCRLNYLT